MFPPFPTEQARVYCAEIISLLKRGELRLVQVSAPSAERDGHGVMIGVLVCEDERGDKIVLGAVSGNSLVPADSCGKQLSSDKPCTACDAQIVWVPPIVTPKEIEAALAPNDRKIHELTAELKSARTDDERRDISEKRAALTTESLKKIHALYNFHTIDKRVLPLSEICGEKLPPTGTGDCCAPKLLNFAFSHALHPVSMDEVFYCPTEKISLNKIDGASYPPCDERCGIILPAMLGLEIVYRDSDIVVVNKQSGLLSVPGRGPEKQDCVVTRLQRIFPSCITQPSVHRLDMETSGLLVLAFTADAQRNLSIQFQKSKVEKKYIALLDGSLQEASGAAAPNRGQTRGEMTLYFRLDIENRPHQIWDEANGKKSVTEWERLGFEWYRTRGETKNRKVTRVLFTPRTGRTHQLRLAASDVHGFGMPIVGDSLYGTCAPHERLMLHASYLSFAHPRTNERLEFTSEVPF